MSTTTPAVEASVSVPFTLSSPGARSVSVAIFFSDWSREQANQGRRAPREEKSHMMVRDLVPLRQVSAGLWRCELPLPVGWYEYLFLVDGAWVMDPDAPEVRPDGAGGFNAARRVEQVPVIEERPVAPAPIRRAASTTSHRRASLRRAG